MAFNLQRARKMMDFCIAAYMTNPSELQSQVSRFAMRQQHFLGNEIVCIHAENSLYDTECFIAHNGIGDIVIAFRGSETIFFTHDGSFRDWVITDFDATPIRYPLDPGPAISLNKGRWVHRGFWSAYNLVRAELHKKLNDILKKNKRDDVRIFSTGHSLGGALAIHAGADLGETFRQYPVHTYSFAAPRVGNNDFNRVFEENTCEAYVTVFRGDPVPFTPPIGPNMDLSNKRYQTPQSIVYIDQYYRIKSSLPVAKVVFRFQDHFKDSYKDALNRIAD